MSFRRALVSLVLSLFILAAVLNAQTTNASIYGSITDASGAVIVKAAVTAVNIKTGVAQNTVSNESGVYIFASLQPGEYRVAAEAAGFRKAVAEHVQLDVSARTSVNLTLAVGATTESVTVEATASQLEATTTSVSAVVTEQRVQDLPLQSRNAAVLVNLQAGVVGESINGARSQSQNITFEGTQIQEPRYNGGISNTTITTSVDNISEFRVNTAPVDAQFGRGMAQIQMVGRSGTNNWHGSVFEYNRVTALSANDWFNNQVGTPRDFLIRNQFGARVGAPIKKNKTFFFFLYEGQRQKTNAAQNEVVFTSTGRQGMFRFFPGVKNGNATSTVPTVDFNGNPLQPSRATGPLQSVSLFGRDPNRLTPDPTGNVAKALMDYPLPNNYLIGDGLNTAGFQWQQPFTNDNNIYSGRIDHALTQDHHLSFTVQIERPTGLNGFTGQTFPSQPTDFARPLINFYTFSATSSIRPTLLNEFRASVNRFTAAYETPFSPSGTSVLPHIGSQPFYLTFATVNNTYSAQNSPQGRLSPIYQYSDVVSWLRGTHSLKFGVGVIFDSSNGYNSFNVIPGATTGAGAVPYANIGTITGIGSNQTQAQNLLGDLSGSLASWTQAFNSAGGKNPTYIPGEPLQRTWRQHEYNGFVQDDWKVRKNLTVNLGVRYEYYSPPFEANGKAVIPVNGTAGAFGISGSSFADAFQPGHLAGSLTVLELVGPRSPNPDVRVFNPQYNTFEPVVGISWSPGSSNKTILRGGYMITSDRNSLRNADTEVGGNPGINSTLTFTSGSLLNLSNVGVPYAPVGQALSVVPLTDRLQTLRVYQTDLRNQYYQNWNFSVQRQITKDSVLSVRYVGTKGSRLLSGVDLNSGEYISNGFVDAFNVTRNGGNAALFDKIFAGLTVPGKGAVDGVNVRGSDYARANSTFASYLADGRVGSFAGNINSSKLADNINGGLLRKAGLPENFFYTNPQFANVYLVGNNANSTFHSMQVEYQKRFGKGWTFQGNYVWSKAIGESELGGTQTYDNNYRNVKNRSFDKRVLTFNRTQVLKMNGTWELPVGKDRAFLSSANRIVDGVIGGWKVSGILTFNTGRPLTVTAPITSFNKTTTGNTPNVSGDLSKNTGHLGFDGNGACYFCNFTQINDPNASKIAPVLAAQTNLLSQQGPGGIILSNPLPGTLGGLGQTFFSGPNFFNLDAALAKTFKITERFNAELRTDWINATNHEDFANANIDLSINSSTFGRITGRNANSNNNRIVVIGLRLNF